MDYLTNAWTTATGTASDYWSNRPPWLGGPPPAPAPTTTTVGARRRKTYRKKSKRRRTGRRSTGFPRLFRM